MAGNAQRLIFIHGTGAGDVSDIGGRWWQVDGVLQRALSSQLGSEFVFSKDGEVFHWSGDNSEEARRRAAVDLLHYLDAAETHGTPYHIVAHSHGGSVLWSTLALAVAHRKKLKRLSSIITVGTPFLQFRGQPPSAGNWVTSGIAIAATVLAASTLAEFWSLREGIFEEGGWLVRILLPVISVLVLAVSIFIVAQLAGQLIRLYSEFKRNRHHIKAFRRWSNSWLAIWSTEDEAINGLSNTLRYNGTVTPRLLASIPKQLAGRIFRRIALPVVWPHNHILAPVIDDLVWSRVIKRLQGNDIYFTNIYAVTVNPTLQLGGWSALPKPINSALVKVADQNAAQALSHARMAFGAAPKGGKLINLLDSLAARLTWQELVHTTYFHSQDIQRLIKDFICAAATKPSDNSAPLRFSEGPLGLDCMSPISKKTIPRSVATASAIVGVTVAFLWFALMAGAWIFADQMLTPYRLEYQIDRIAETPRPLTPRDQVDGRVANIMLNYVTGIGQANRIIAFDQRLAEFTAKPTNSDMSLLADVYQSKITILYAAGRHQEALAALSELTDTLKKRSKIIPIDPLVLVHLARYSRELGLSGAFAPFAEWLIHSEIQNRVVGGTTSYSAATVNLLSLLAFPERQVPIGIPKMLKEATFSFNAGKSGIGELAMTLEVAAKSDPVAGSSDVAASIVRLVSKSKFNEDERYAGLLLLLPNLLGEPREQAFALLIALAARHSYGESPETLLARAMGEIDKSLDPVSLFKGDPRPDLVRLAADLSDQKVKDLRVKILRILADYLNRQFSNAKEVSSQLLPWTLSDLPISDRLLNIAVRAGHGFNGLSAITRNSYIVDHSPYASIVLPAVDEIPFWDIQLVRTLAADGNMELAADIIMKLNKHGYPLHDTIVIVSYRRDEWARAMSLAKPLAQLNDPVRIASFALALHETGCNEEGLNALHRAESLIAREANFERRTKASVLAGLVLARHHEFRRAFKICADCPEPYQLAVYSEVLKRYSDGLKGVDPR